MKIAVVTSQFPVPGEPGRGRPLLQTIAALAESVAVRVFVPSARYPAHFAPSSYKYVRPQDGAQNVNGVDVRYLSYATLPWLGRITNGFAVGHVLREPLREFAPDLILSYWLYPDAFGAVRVARSLGIPCVVGARGSDLRVRDRLSLMLTGRALARSDHLLAVSDDLRRIAIERFGVPATAATTVPNGCNVGIFRRGDRSAARAALGVPDNARLILYVGRLVAAKGLRELLTAWTSLTREDANVRVAFVGEGPMGSELREMARSEGVEDRVLLPGACGPEAVATWMQACDVFCLPSHSEGYPNVLVEALACGRPVVATAVGGILEIVDASNGLLVPVRDEVRLRASLHEALTREWDEAALSRRFSRSWQDVARETLQVCTTLMRVTPVQRFREESAGA